jgi:hypothetical protein
MGHVTAISRLRGLAIASSTLVAGGVAVYSYRCSLKTTEIVPFTPMFVAGVIVLALPYGWAVHSFGDESTRRVISVVLTIAITALIATRRTGNLGALWYPHLLVAALATHGVCNIVLSAVCRLKRRRLRA